MLTMRSELSALKAETALTTTRPLAAWRDLPEQFRPQVAKDTCSLPH